MRCIILSGKSKSNLVNRNGLCKAVYFAFVNNAIKQNKHCEWPCISSPVSPISQLLFVKRVSLLVQGVLQVLLQPLGLWVNAHLLVVLQFGTAGEKCKFSLYLVWICKYDIMVLKFDIFRHSNCSISKQSLLSIKLQEPIVSRFWMPYNRNPIVSISHTIAEQLCIQAQPSSWFSVTPLFIKWYCTALSHHSKYSFPASAFLLSLQVLTDCQIVITLFLVALSKKITLYVLSAQVNHLFSIVYNWHKQIIKIVPM